MICKDPRSIREKIAIFRPLFSGLDYVYGTYDTHSGKARQVKEPVTNEVILRHLTGKQSFGVYLLMGDVTRAVVADFDDEDANGPLEFMAVAAHYGIPAYVERSKQKGHHIWCFMDERGVSAAKARMVFRHITEEIGRPRTEIFPKQTKIDIGAQKYGNFINAPLMGQLVLQNRTVFLDPKRGLTPFPNQWAFLESILRVPETQLDEIIEANEIVLSTVPPHPTPPTETEPPLAICLPQPGSLPLCARRMLKEGVIDNQRVACFRLAVHLRKTGLPSDIVSAALQQWATKNRPQNGKRVITETEVRAQVASAFLKEYHGCGCEETAVLSFCDESCPLNDKHRISTGNHS